MEKTISPEERIKRAEEIYYRKRLDNNSIRMSSSQVKNEKEKKQFSLYKKMTIQILVCILIYLSFSLIKNANYIFSDEVMNKTKVFLSQDINFEVILNNTKQFYENNKDKFGFLGNWLKEDNNEQENNQVENTNNEQNTVNNAEANQQTNNATNEAKTDKKNTINNVLTGKGGAATNEVTVSASSSSNSSKKTQMQIDAEYIKKNFSIGYPLKGVVTSRYGKREQTEIVSANHQGIDIGVNQGTTIVASMAGKVTLVSTKGEYGTHVKIENKDVSTIYAHCSKILVKNGATIKKGQKIALSGNTGRTTGPHLHFEIRRNNRTVDPELILTNWGRVPKVKNHRFGTGH